MGKRLKNGKNKKFKHDALETAGPSNGDLVPMASTQVFDTTELLEMILDPFSTTDLLTKLQRVSRRWRAVAMRKLRPLWANDRSSQNSEDCRRVINPLILAHFGQLFNDGFEKILVHTGSGGQGAYVRENCPMLRLPIAQTNGTRAVHDSYARQGASWRDMQIYMPPVYELRYRRETEGQVEILHFSDGVRMGPIYDLIAAIATRAWHKARWYAYVTWPLLLSEALGWATERDGGGLCAH